MKLNIPYLLIAFRFTLAPIILWIAYSPSPSSKFIVVVLMFLGLISDILDGIIARKQGISTASMRRMDSQTDMIFWLSIGFATYWYYPEIITANWASISAILLMEGACYIISWLRFGKEPCTHAFLAKMWGLSLLVAFTSLIGFGTAGIAFYTAIVLGLISHIDRILITLLLPEWEHDIPSSYHAWRIRRGHVIKRNKYLNG